MSFLRKIYYDLKPFLPVQLRMAVRRSLARRLLPRVANVWPIYPAAAAPPPEWSGWPEGKQFAFVITHDVEGPVGLANCERLVELEKELGFRSSFNFIPEGKYRVSNSLLNHLRKESFEIGVHDLHHNGKLYRSKDRFDAAAPRINRYLREWNAVGFRSGFMHRNLDWLHALDIEYDMSTFDTDPFEPQPDGADTIFPFWVANPSSSSRHSPFATQQGSTIHQSSIINHQSPAHSSSLNRQSSIINHQSRPGYVELPYTLPQDSTLFLVLREKSVDIWKSKLDWIAQNGGMALLNVHPDYISFHGEHRHTTYPHTLYVDFLNYIKEKYGGSVYCALPRLIADSVTTRAKVPMENNQDLCKPVA